MPPPRRAKVDRKCERHRQNEQSGIRKISVLRALRHAALPRRHSQSEKGPERPRAQKNNFGSHSHVIPFTPCVGRHVRAERLHRGPCTRPHVHARLALAVHQCIRTTSSSEELRDSARLPPVRPRPPRPALIVQVVDTTTDRETTPTLRKGVDYIRQARNSCSSSKFIYYRRFRRRPKKWRWRASDVLVGSHTFDKDASFFVGDARGRALVLGLRRSGPKLHGRRVPARVAL